VQGSLFNAPDGSPSQGFATRPFSASLA